MTVYLLIRYNHGHLCKSLNPCGPGDCVLVCKEIGAGNRGP
jgi:hypothetical protein